MSSTKSQSLRGVTILDCSILLPGPLVGKHLASLGARVIKVEHPIKPDPALLLASGAYYRDLNEKKEIIKLDLESPKDRVEFERLLAQADGLIEAFRPAVKKRMGLEADRLHAINPRLCIASLCGYPENGPWADRAGHNLNFEAATGCLSLFKEMPPLPLADVFGAQQAALELVAALFGVRTGAHLGTRLTVSLADSLLDLQSATIREFKDTGHVPTPGSNLFSGLFPCYRIYRTRDGKRVAMGAIEEKFWSKAIALLGLPHLMSARLETGAAGASAIAELQRAFESRDWAQWQPLFENADCCVEVEKTYTELF